MTKLHNPLPYKTSADWYWLQRDGCCYILCQSASQEVLCVVREQLTKNHSLFRPWSSHPVSVGEIIQWCEARSHRERVIIQTAREVIGKETERDQNKYHVSSFRCSFFINPLKPNDPYRGRTTPLTSKRCILYIYSTNISTEYFKHGIYSPFFF